MDELIDRSRRAREDAYAPYSEYRVGSSIRASDGSIYTGCNIEISRLSNTVHAEEMAIVKAVMDGRTEFEAVCVSSSNGATPCGMCRHTLSEFCNGGVRVIVDSIEDGRIEEYTLSELHPASFSLSEAQSNR